MLKIRFYDWLDSFCMKIGDDFMNFHFRFKYPSILDFPKIKPILIKMGAVFYRLSMRFGYRAFQLREKRGLNP